MNWKKWKSLFSKKTLTRQEAKMKEVLEANKKLLAACEVHINADIRVSDLDAMEILVGSASVMYEDQVRDQVNTYMLTGELPKGPIGETIKKMADQVTSAYGLSGTNKEKLPGKEERQLKFQVVPNDITIAEKQFETEEKSDGKKTIH